MKNLNLSYYTISVKLNSEPDKYLLVHGYTGAIDIVNEKIWEQMNNFSENHLLPPEIINLLVQRGYLTTKNKAEEVEHVTQLAQTLHKVQKKLYKSFGFIVTYNCNFRCPYCFENIISKHGNNWGKQVFTKEMVDKAYEAMFKIEPRKELHTNKILLYGGEPLLSENKDIVSYILLKGAQLGYSFKIITNGYDIDHYIDVLDANYIYLIQITIDGNREHHNSRRFHYLEGNSYDKILKNIGLLINKNINVVVRVNTDNNNIHDFNFLKDEFKALGYDKSSHLKIYSSFLRKFKDNLSVSQNIDYLPNIESLHRKSRKEYNELIYCHDFNIAKDFYYYLVHKSRCKLYSASCTSQFGSYIFDPKGDIYTCTEIVGRKEHIIGSYLGDDIQWSEVRNHWFEKNTSNSVGCKDCKYSLLCGGPCLARVPHTKSGFNSFYCSEYKKIFSLSVNKAYTAYKNNEPVY